MGESSISTLLLNFEKWGARSWDASLASSWSENLTSVKCVGEPDEESELASSVSVSLTASRAARNSLPRHNRLLPSSSSQLRRSLCPRRSLPGTQVRFLPSAGAK